MTNSFASYKIPIAIACSILVIVFLVVASPWYLTDIAYLGGILFLEFLVAIIWNYQKSFFPFLMLIFLLAGTNVPLSGQWGRLRWVMLAVGALFGIILYFKDHPFPFHTFHLFAVFCIVSAATSAVVSSFPKQAMLKALSLFLLFAYASCGARLALASRKDKFLSAILLGCELLIYFTTLEYFVLHRAFLGNPNSLGMIMGIVAIPLMLWAVLAGETRLRKRRTFALFLSLALLFSSYARAAETAAAVSFVLLCLFSRRYRLLFKSAVVALIIAISVGYLVPLQNGTVSGGTLRSKFLFKGKEEGGILGSRKSVWDTTIASVQQHPWFGTGFGTVKTSYEPRAGEFGNFSSNSQTSREHGNSYLALLEGVGFLGVVPFVGFLICAIIPIITVLKLFWQTRDPSPVAVALATVLVAGFVHAFFEDWLFAVGNYMCVFFWALAFILPDTLYREDSGRDQTPSFQLPDNWTRDIAYSPGQ